MPELPDITLYAEGFRTRIVGQPLEKIRLTSPFLVRTTDPPLHFAQGKEITGVRRIGKQIVWEFQDHLFLIFHLMISGRFSWKRRGEKSGGKIVLAAFDFPNGTVALTEASGKKRASLHVVRGESSLSRFDRGGLEVLEAGEEKFRETLFRENHTLKRALTDPRLFAGIGNAFSDEILHRAKMSPLRQTTKLVPSDCERLYRAAREILVEWTERLRQQAGEDFPARVTAFRPEMAVHGKFRQPCPDCGTAVQRIAYADNECNYCPRCQTEGKILADRSLSRLLRGDWPKTIEELETNPALLKPP